MRHPLTTAERIAQHRATTAALAGSLVLDLDTPEILEALAARDVAKVDREFYSVDGHMFAAEFLPTEAPTLTEGDEIKIATWIRVAVDLTAYDFEEGEHVTFRERRGFLSYTVDAGPDGRPFLTPTYAPANPDAIEVKYGSFIWVGGDLYRVAVDTFFEQERHKLGLVRPRPSRGRQADEDAAIEAADAEEARRTGGTFAGRYLADDTSGQD